MSSLASSPEPPLPSRRREEEEDGADRSPSSSAPFAEDNRLLVYLANAKSQLVAQTAALSSQSAATRTATATATATGTAPKPHAGEGDHVRTAPMPRGSRMHFVMGNEAGDADSVTSAIAHAFVLQHHRVQSEGGGTGSGTGGSSTDPEPQRPVVFVPVVPISIRDLQTQRPETLFLLRTLAGLKNLDEILCDIDELVEFLSADRASNTDDESRRGRHRITLVDHNQLSASLRAYAADDPKIEPILEVVGIVDHHRDMGFHTDTCPETPASCTSEPATDSTVLAAIPARNIAFDDATGHPLVASTCTLVVEELLKAGVMLELPPQVAVLLLGTILLDSINLDPRAGKVTDRDKAAVHELLQRTNWDSLGPDAKRALGMSGSHLKPDCTTLFDLLQSAKFDPTFWGSLSVRDALRLDYKQFSTEDSSNSNSAVWGMSTVLLDYETFAKKPGWEQAVREYMTELQLDLLVMMLPTSSVTSGGDATAGSEVEDKPAPLERKLVLCDLRAGSIVNDLVDHLTGPNAPLDLKLVEMPDKTQALNSDTSSDISSVYVRAFHQGNAKASRKQVAPILFDYFEGLVASSQSA